MPELSRRTFLGAAVLGAAGLYGPRPATAGITGAEAVLGRLVRAYPNHLARVEGRAVVWRDGTVMVGDDGVEGKDFRTLLDRPDLKDQFAFPYPCGPIAAPPEHNHDPGRIRNEPFFTRMYGATAAEVERRLVPVRWLSGRTVSITSVNGVDRRLQAVSDDLQRLPESLRKYVTHPAGTFNWRVIAATGRLSPHSFGFAIDIDTAFADYWQWTGAREGSPGIRYRNRIPFEIVEIFEQNGFIWGGKWYHYDTMHFEYRPEVLGC